MIFKALFRPKHQHTDPAVRIEAIAGLDPLAPEQKSQLHELAFNDESPSVRLAALERLDSFALWWKLAQTEKNERVHKQAQQQVEHFLLAEDSQRLDHKQRLTFVRECSNLALLEKLLLKKWQHDLDPELSLLVLNKIDKPALNHKVLQESSNLGLCQAILAEVEDEAVLNRVARKHPLAELAEAARDKLTELTTRQQQQQQQEKSLRLVLAKMLALKDQQDYARLTSEHQALMQEYQSLSEGLTQQLDALQQELSSKYQQLSDKLYARQRELEPAWREQQQAAQEAQQRSDLLAGVESVVEQVQAQLAAIDNFNESWQGQVAARLSEAGQMLQGLSPCAKTEALQNRLTGLQAQLQSLPAFDAAVIEAKQLYSRLQQLDLPSSVDEWQNSRQQWQQIRMAYRQAQSSFNDIWPADLNNQWQQLDKSWRQASKKCEAEVKDLTNKVRSSLHKVQDRVQTGKFHAAIGLYQRICSWYQALPEPEQDKLKRAFEQAQQRVEALKDWQAYLAQPRKPALLEEVQKLPGAEMSVQARAEKVKQLRKDWNSLGRIDTSEDEALNQAFDMACEVAFEPVRQHYAEQETRRAENLQIKKSLIEQLTGLSAEQLPMDELNVRVNKIKQQWRDAGEVDYRELEGLNQAYRVALDPLHERIHAWHNDNAGQKNRLLEKAKSLLTLEDSMAASEQAKSLQEQWKQVGHAGHKQEKILWQQFRQINDQLFASRNATLQQGREQQDATEKRLSGLVENTRNEISSAESESAVRAALQAGQEQWHALLDQLSGRALQIWQQRLDAVEQQANQAIDGIHRAQQQEDLAMLFKLLADWQEDQLPVNLDRLPSRWRTAFERQPGQQNRHQLTLLMELTAGKPSPTEDEDNRRELQMQMMAAKLQGEPLPDLEALLEEWVAHGSLNERDRSLLGRVKTLF